MSTSAHREPGRFLLISAPAKINLYLGVHNEKDERGYHRVDSVMTTLDLADVIAIGPADELSVHTVPPSDFPMDQNSAYRAARAMGEAFGRDANFAILIDKRIPQQAGLGGPSADAAATILGIATYWGVDARDPRLDEVARSIGADVPFFLYGPPAWCDGAGDTVRELFRPLTGTPVALVKPQGAGVTTQAAYEHFDAHPVEAGALEPMLDALRLRDKERIFSHISNNLAPAACAIDPSIAEVLQWMREQDDVLAADVSGSGACVFAVCASTSAAEAIAQSAEQRGWWSCATSMEKSGPYIAAG